MTKSSRGKRIVAPLSHQEPLHTEVGRLLHLDCNNPRGNSGLA
jgi:hypothetical protein